MKKNITLLLIAITIYNGYSNNTDINEHNDNRKQNDVIIKTNGLYRAEAFLNVTDINTLTTIYSETINIIYASRKAFIQINIMHSNSKLENIYSITNLNNIAIKRNEKTESYSLCPFFDEKRKSIINCIFKKKKILT